MGVQIMDNNIKKLANEFGAITICPHCSGMMIKETRTLIRNYKDVQLQLTNFPITKCLNHSCAEEIYGSGTLIKMLKMAKANYDHSNETTLNCSNS